mgnify:CR=1 FL=1
MKNYTKVPAPKGLPAWPAAMLVLSAERPRGVSRAGGRVSLACAAVGAIDRESERGEESARLLTQSWTRTVVDARRTRDIDLRVSRVSSQLYMPRPPHLHHSYSLTRSREIVSHIISMLLQGGARKEPTRDKATLPSAARCAVFLLHMKNLP